MTENTAKYQPSKRFVIIGASFAGLDLFLHLLKFKEIQNGKVELTLIDYKNFFEFTPSILHCFYNPEHENKIIIPDLEQHLSKKLPSDSNHIHFKLHHYVEHVNTKEKKVQCKNLFRDQGDAIENIPYDHLFVCSGSSYKNSIKVNPNDQFTISFQERKNEIQNMKNQILNAKSILVIGTGLVGVELMGEIIDLLRENNTIQEKQLTMIGSANQMIPRNGERAGTYVEHYLKKYGVRTILGEKIDTSQLYDETSGNSAHVDTDKGTQIEKPDLIFECVGIYPNTQFIDTDRQQHIQKNQIGQIQVDNYLCAKGCRDEYDIFALGDCNDYPEEKMAYTAEHQVEYICQYVIPIVVKDATIRNLHCRPYQSGVFAAACSLGNQDAVLSLGQAPNAWLLLSGRLARFMKRGVEKYGMWRLS